MRRRLMACAAMTPLVFGWQAARAQATLTIANTQTTAVATATAVSSGPGDIVISSGGAVNPASGTVAVTLNSNNSVTNSGSIQFNNVDNSTAIRVAPGGFTGSVTNAGQLVLSESYTASDTANGDGIVEAPYAKGFGRTAIQVSGPLTGIVSNSGSITIQANGTATQPTVGIAIDAPLIAPSGNTAALLSHSGSMSIVGDNAYGVRTTAEIGGEVRITGSITMKGQNSVGVLTTAPIDGAFRLYSAVQTTGYALTSRSVGTTVLKNVEKTPADVQQGGSGVQIQGNVLGGVFLGAPPSGTVSTDTTTDADSDGVIDSVEGSSSITTYGSAPALQIGSASAPITLGAFGAGTNAFGLIVEGTISGQGIFDGVTASAVDIGGGQPVTVTGGIKVTGTVSAVAYQADATTVRLRSGVNAATFQNSGAISGTITSASANTATVLQIDAGATVNNFVNSGTMTAGVTGDSANASVVIDKSGTLNSVTNQGQITTTFTASSPGQVIAGRGIALDLSTNKTGVSLLQSQNSNTPTFTPAIVGDVLLSSTGSNTVDLENGSIQGTLSLGSAAGSLTINNAAGYAGQLLYSGSGLAINVANGVLKDTSPTTVGASSLTFGATSTLTVALDPAHNAASQFNVSGAATFASGAKIGATLLSTPSAAGQTFVIVKSPSLSVGAGDLGFVASLPYLFDGSLSSNTTAGAGSISITVRTKSAAELGFNKAEAAAFPAIYAALPQDSGIQTAIIAATTRQSLISSFDQLLPESGGDVFETTRGMSKAVSRAASERFDLTTEAADEDIPSKTGFWASEFYSGVEQKKQDNNAYHSAGLGVIGGYDVGGAGFTISAASANVSRPGITGDSSNSISVVEGGLYAAPRFGPIFFDARVGAGYVKVADRRQLVVSVVSGDLSTTSTVSRTVQGDWSGYDFTGHVGAGVQWNLGRHLFFQPKVYADVFHLHETGYSERNDAAGTAPQGFLLDVQQRDSTQSNATASLVTGLKFGSTFVFRPQVELGYDDVISGGAGNTTARFAYGGPNFTVAANHLGGAALGRITLRGDGNFVHFSLQGGGEYNNAYHSMDLKAVFRLLF